MVRRSEQSPAQPASGDIREIAFQWVRLRNFDGVEIVTRTGERGVFENLPIGSDRSVFAELKKPVSAMLRRGRLRALGHGEPDIVAFRFFEEQSGQGKDRIGDWRGFNLRDNTLECLLMWQETNRDGERFVVNLRAALARLAVVTLRILRARRPTIAIRTI